MNFGFDHDGTWTAAPHAMYSFAFDLMNAGHKCFLTTMRYPSEADTLHPIARLAIDCGVITPIYTSRKAKAPACEAQGVKIHVWLDDVPQAIYMDGEALQAAGVWNGPPAPEGQPYVPTHD